MSPSKRGLDMERKPLLGSLWMLGFAFFFSFTSAFTKMLYDWNPAMSSIEVIFHRCNIQIIFFLALINVNIKKLLWDDLPRDIWPELISKMLQRAAVMFCLQYSIKFIDITVVSVLSNTAPLATAVLGYIMLSEKISTVEVISLFTSFIGVLVLTMSGMEKENRYDLDD